MKFAIVGGGIGGLTAAYRLCQRKEEVQVFEKTGQLGGQARTVTIKGGPVEVYYHHYNREDTALFGLCKELGIDIEWFNAPMWFLKHGKLYDFNTPLDLLKFSPLSLKGKLWFAVDMFYNIRAYPEVYNVIWEPLLKHKFGDYYKDVPMTYVYSRPRSNGKLAYIHGSTQSLIDALRDRITGLNGKILMEKTPEPGNYYAVIDTSQRTDNMIPVTCVMAVLDRPLTKYYWLNIGDDDFPFGHVVQKNNIVYLAKYGKAEPDFVSHLKRINKEFNDSWIEHIQVFKDEYAQPINVATEERGLDKTVRKAEKSVTCC